MVPLVLLLQGIYFCTGRVCQVLQSEKAVKILATIMDIQSSEKCLRPDKTHETNVLEGGPLGSHSSSCNPSL